MVLWVAGLLELESSISKSLGSLSSIFPFSSPSVTDGTISSVTLCDSSPSGMHSCLPQAFEQLHVRDPQPTVPIEHTFLHVPVLQRLGKRVNKHSPFHWSHLRHSPRFGSPSACVHEHQEEMRPHWPRVSSDSTMNACPAFCSSLIPPS